MTRADQVSKLRECLSGHARQLVPNTMLNISTAWDVLHTAFGDSARVMQARKEKVVNLGPYPSSGRSSNTLKQQVEWLLSLELAMKDIIELGLQNSDMDREAFSGGTISKILALFPISIQADLTVCKGDGRERLMAIVEEVAKLREVRQQLLRNAELAEGFNPNNQNTTNKQGNSRGNGGGHGNARQNGSGGPSSTRHGGGQSGGSQGRGPGARSQGGQSGGSQGGGHGARSQGGGHSGGSQGGNHGGKQGGSRSQGGHHSSGSRSVGHGQGQGRQGTPHTVTLTGVLYAPFKRDEGCRICTVLDTRGDTVDIYESHRSNYATGCPRFAAMTPDERREIVKEARLCFRCLDPDFVISWTPRNNSSTNHNPHPKCLVTQDQRSTFTCRSKTASL